MIEGKLKIMLGKLCNFISKSTAWIPIEALKGSTGSPSPLTKYSYMTTSAHQHNLCSQFGQLAMMHDGKKQKSFPVLEPSWFSSGYEST